MALVFDYLSFGIPLGSWKGKSVQVNMMLGGGVSVDTQFGTV